MDIDLPLSYEEFLGEFGWGSVDHWEIFGLGSDVPPYLDLIRTTLAERRAGLSPYLVPVMNDGGGNLYCLDTSRFAEDECPIVLWNHEDQKTHCIASDFAVWVLRKLDPS